MAGIDYSKVREPDYDPAALRQRPEITQMVERSCETVLRYWEQREIKKQRLREEKDFEERTRRIFYDTDNILENQREVIRVCADCAGALRIESASSRGQRILAIHIPRKACSRCRDLGRQWYETAEWGDFDHIFMQDRPTDTYLERK